MGPPRSTTSRYTGAPTRRPFLAAVDEAALHGHLSAHSGEALDMLVDGPGRQLQPPGMATVAWAEAAQQRTQQVVACADTPRQVVGRAGGSGWRGSRSQWRAGSKHAHLRPASRIEKNRVTSLIWGVLDTAYAIHQQGGRDDSYSGVFRTADGHFTKNSSAADHVYSRQFPSFQVIGACMRRRCAGVKSAKHSVSRQRSVHTAQYKVLSVYHIFR